MTKWSNAERHCNLRAAEAAGFEVMVTGDHSLLYQQNLAKRKLALVA